MKKLTMALAVGALTLSLAGIGSADTDINIYGASAQVNFWAGLASTYLADPAGANCTGAVKCYDGAGGGVCTPASPVTYAPKDGGGTYYHGASYFIATGSSCGIDGGGNVTIRVGSYDSADGIQSVIGNTNVIDVKGCTGNKRTQLNSYLNNTLACFPTTLGSADVDGTTIIQTSQGRLDGPTGLTSPTLVTGSDGKTYDLGKWLAPADAYGALGYTPVDTTSANSLVTDYHPVIVPFAFFANKDLAAVGDGLLAANLTNLTTAQAEQIFSGNVKNWNQFGFPAGAVTLCLRVAGSGTYGTFAAGVMKTNDVGPTLPTIDHSMLPVAPTTWFNNTTGDMMNCINSTPGAIGFADADRANAASTFGPVAFNGVVPNATTIKNGLYDRFWSLEHIFELKTLSSTDPATHAVVVNLTGWAASRIPPAKANFWVNSNAVQWHKSGDFTYPPATGAYTQSKEY